MAFSKSGFGVLVDGKAVHQYPMILFFLPPPALVFLQGGRESGACLAGLSDFEKALRLLLKKG